MFRKALIRTVAGAIGGFANREAIVLCSAKQKIGKTWFISFLSPWGESKYFSSEPIVQNKDQMFRICQNMIYLLDEIGQKATNEKHSDYLKMLLSKQSVNERRVYDVDNTSLTRKVTFWGTTNLPYLYQGQNTRWISIPVREINHNYDNKVSGTKEIDINAVWAEAYAAYMAGEDFELDREDLMEQERLNQDWIMGSEALGLVATYIQAGPEWKTAEQILNSLSPSNPNIIKRITVRGLKEALQVHGIECKIEKIKGYKMELFKCQVVDGLSFGRELDVKLEAPF
jgi:predicted P-loop ATPase